MKEPIRNRVGAAAALARIRKLNALRTELMATRDRELLEVHEKRTPEITEASAEIDSLEQRLEDWADKNRKAEFEGGQSTEFSSGFLRYRKGPPKLVIARPAWGWEDVLSAALKAKGRFEGYIKREPELDRQTLLTDAKGEHPRLEKHDLTVIGLKLIQEEQFSCEPKPEDTTAQKTPSA